MPLVFTPEPPEIAAVFKASLEQMVSKQAFSTARLSRMSVQRPGEPPARFQALPLYHVGLADLAEGRDLSAAVQTGWRYLLKHDDEIVASADAIFAVAGQAPVFAQVNEGPFVGGTVSAIKAARGYNQIDKSDYEVRLLMVPALYTVALWLVNTAGEEDLAVAIAPAPPAFAADKPVPLKQFVAELQEAAKDALTAQPPSEPMGGGGIGGSANQ